ncbi:MAG TPA: hypothetical protein VI056_05370 [Candidatus Limnocylindria bacterium]
MAETRAPTAPEATAVAASDLARILVIADEAAQQQQPLAPRDLSALCYLLGTDPDAEVLGCAYQYRFSPGPTSGEFEIDLAQLEASGYAERHSPLTVSTRGRAWLDEASRATAVVELRAIAKRVLPRYLVDRDLVERSVRRSQEITQRALDRDLAEMRELERPATT